MALLLGSGLLEMSDLVGGKAMFVIDMMEELEKRLDIDHGDGTYTDGRTIDN